MLPLCLQVTVGDDEDAPLLKVSDRAKNPILKLLSHNALYMLLFQTPNIDASLLCMAATMDPLSPVACCEHVLGVASWIPTQFLME